MTKEVKKYKCEWPDCGKEYTTLEKARQCQARGQENPIFEEGLVLLTKDDFEKRFGLYHFIVLTRRLRRLRKDGHDPAYGAVVYLSSPPYRTPYFDVMNDIIRSSEIVDGLRNCTFRKAPEGILDKLNLITQNLAFEYPHLSKIKLHCAIPNL